MTARHQGYLTRAQIGLNPPKSVTALNGRRMEGVAVHHGAGATPTTHTACITTWRAYQRMHMSDPRDPKVDIAYNYGVCPHGYVLEGRTWRYQPGANGIPWNSDDMVSFGRAIREGFLAVCTNDVERLTGQPARSVRHMIEENAGMLRAAAAG